MAALSRNEFGVKRDVMLLERCCCSLTVLPILHIKNDGSNFPTQTPRSEIDTCLRNYAQFRYGTVILVLVRGTASRSAQNGRDESRKMRRLCCQPHEVSMYQELERVQYHSSFQKLVLLLVPPPPTIS